MRCTLVSAWIVADHHVEQAQETDRLYIRLRLPLDDAALKQINNSFDEVRLHCTTLSSPRIEDGGTPRVVRAEKVECVF